MCMRRSKNEQDLPCISPIMGQVYLHSSSSVSLIAFIKLRAVTNEAAAELAWAWQSAGGSLKLMAGASGVRIGPMERVGWDFTFGFLPWGYAPRNRDSRISDPLPSLPRGSLSHPHASLLPTRWLSSSL